MWKRIELHNHSMESDGCMSVEELAGYLSSQHIPAFSLTDHNTISGHRKLQDACLKLPIEYLHGYELTSWYGHLLCQNVTEYISWEDIDQDCADPFFVRVHQAGGLAGPAHPCSLPSPFSNGMNWSMKIKDYGLIDFIEVINNMHPMEPDNQKAILWWERLIFAGYSICPVAGTDLHGPVAMDGFFTTYIKTDINPGSNAEPPTLAQQFDTAIRSCSACVTKGPILDWEITESGLDMWLEPGSTAIGGPYLCQIRTADDTFDFALEREAYFDKVPPLLQPGTCATVMLFEKEIDFSCLIAIARPMFIDPTDTW